MQNKFLLTLVFAGVATTASAHHSKVTFENNTLDPMYYSFNSDSDCAKHTNTLGVGGKISVEAKAAYGHTNINSETLHFCNKFNDSMTTSVKAEIDCGTTVPIPACTSTFYINNKNVTQEGGLILQSSNDNQFYLKYMESTGGYWGSTEFHLKLLNSSTLKRNSFMDEPSDF